MKKLGKVLRIIYWTVTVLALIVVVTAATYAWFTNNRRTTTDTATSRTGTESLTLQISQQGGGSFSPMEETPIVQVNEAETENLMPVSTNNLQNFLYNPTTVEGQAKSFHLLENEEHYYHGRIFLRAEAEGMPEGSRMALYLDQAEEAGGSLVSNVSGELLSAARLGLMFDGDAGQTTIFRFGDGYNDSGSAGNTFVGNTQLGEGQVLSWNGSEVVGTADPSVTVDEYTIQMEGTSVTLPEEPLLYMNYNQIYQLDIYFYIEGCDPDAISDPENATWNLYRDSGDLHLAFYGMTA